MSSLRGVGAILLEGFLISLPVLLVYLMLGGVVDGLLILTTPVVDLMPADLFDSPAAHRWVAVGILVVSFLVIGLAARTAPMQRFGAFVEAHTLARFAPYAILKSLSQGIGGQQAEGRLQPAILSVSPETRMLVAIVEELPDDELCVFVPMAPTPAVGFLQVVARSKVEPLDVSMTDALGAILNWGGGMGEVLEMHAASSRGRGEEGRGP